MLAPRRAIGELKRKFSANFRLVLQPKNVCERFARIERSAVAMPPHRGRQNFERAKNDFKSERALFTVNRDGRWMPKRRRWQRRRRWRRQRR